MGEKSVPGESFRGGDIESRNNVHINAESDNPPEDRAGPKYPGPLAFALLLIGVCLAAFIVALGRSIVATAIPQITDHFGSPGDVGWYGSAYLLTACAFQPLFGRVYVHFNIRDAYLLSLAFFELGSLLCGIAPTSTALIVGRALSGIGEAGIIAGNLNIISLSAPLEKRAVYIGLVGSIFGVGSVGGPIIGGALTSRVSWRWCFYLNLPVGAVTLVALLCVFSPQKSPRTSEPLWKRLLHLDLVGNILIMAAVIMLLLALQWGGTSMPWSSSRIIGLLVGFGVVSISFLIWQWYYGAEALLPLHIITQRTVSATIASSFFLSGAVLVYTYYLPYWFQAIKNASALESGVDTIPYVASSFVAAMLGAITVNKTGYLNIPLLAGPIIATIGAGLLYTLKINTPTARWVGYEILGAAGAGMAIQQYFLAIQGTLPEQEVPVGTALVLFSQNLSGAIFVSVGSSIIRNKLLAGLYESRLEGVDIQAIITAGATELRGLVNTSQLQPLLTLYNNALENVFIMAVPLTVLALICALPIEWKDLRGGAKNEAEN